MSKDEVCHCMKNAQGVIEVASGTCPEHGTQCDHCGKTAKVHKVKYADDFGIGSL